VDSDDFDATTKPLQERHYQKAAIVDTNYFCHPAFSNNKKRHWCCASGVSVPAV